MRAKEFCEKFAAAGVIPPNTRRMIIDVQAGCAVKVYFDTYGNETLLQLITPEMLMDGQEIVHIQGGGDATIT